MQHTAESAILDYFGSSTVKNEDERKIIGAIIHEQITLHGFVTNKAVILRLINMLDSSHDVLEQDVLRNALEMVLCRTEDDTGF
ncbi:MULTISPECIES: biofilm development regulator YmgB/AriR family protein [Erwiniaceae]|uniref:Two-component-system connector protein AriR n=1 Tax=Pantoea coffeiphila TaxID=1465635 RepID=A0A2S9I9D2_9GAMM|nr:MULTISPECIES: biofilm development regulator YmgB/AriR family protein [Erwiniaceae]MBK0002748.1 hypothetical protein [Erwinia sp. S38]MCW1877863.1 biofilm development regulator YmgB/AriR family protein [Erwinia sp. INIA01]PRD14387.1 hypothetical protein CQW29_16105 [Pantoea coffeiphila]